MEWLFDEVSGVGGQVSILRTGVRPILAIEVRIRTKYGDQKDARKLRHALALAIHRHLGFILGFVPDSSLFHAGAASGGCIDDDRELVKPGHVPRLETGEEQLGFRMKLLRIRAGLTQEALSGKSGICRSHISKIERGHSRPNLRTLATLAKVLSVSLEDLVSQAKPGQRSNEHLNYTHVFQRWQET